MKKILITTAILIFTAVFSIPALGQQELSGEWELTRMVRDGKELPMVTTGKTPTIKFGEGFAGNGSCNSYGGSYTIEGKKFKAGPIRATKMACAGEVNAQEMAYFSLLEKMDSYQILKGTLTMAGEGGLHSLTFAVRPDVRSPVEEAAEETRPEPKEKTLLWIVDKGQVDCRGIVPQKCLQVKQRDFDEWQILRAEIGGFKYKPGRYYLIRVKRTMKSWTMANGQVYDYKLVKVISRTRLMPHVD
jgi:heat shock protein HslJ